MFRFLCMCSLIASFIFTVKTVNDISNLPSLISCIVFAVLFACLNSLQNRVVSLEEKLNTVENNESIIDTEELNDMYTEE